MGESRTPRPEPFGSNHYERVRSFSSTIQAGIGTLPVGPSPPHGTTRWAPPLPAGWMPGGVQGVTLAAHTPSDIDALLTVPGAAMSAAQREALMKLPAFSDQGDPLFGPAVWKYRDATARAAERAVATGAIDAFGRPARPASLTPRCAGRRRRPADGRRAGPVGFFAGRDGPCSRPGRGRCRAPGRRQ